ncbi:MAG: hypothetical protein A2172_02415 [Candidatus Woykebacteria bacterium RBG_13_40_15]|uniref:Dockerin domain-containing protein n=1 Tax=Candidatus Woykebacteria bacterium RBG_13_40_15 TaxID=1802593 RepID=A0A1G1W6J4_9BACT|nr:MAG: hypothetical protein A2172_02415 [Candidatus Woykebacteria bacterium RBG_13_40_15]
MRAADLFQKYRKSINPPYDPRDLISLFLTVFLLITIPLTVISILQTREPTSKAVANPSGQQIVQKVYCSAEPLESFSERPDKNRAKVAASKLASVTVDLTQKQQEFKKDGSVKAAKELQSLLQERKSDLVETMRQNPDQALNSLLSDQERSNFAPLAQNCLERSATIEGQLEVVHADFFKEGTSTTSYTLKTDSGKKISIHPAGGLRAFLESRTRVKVKGMQIDNDLVFDGSRPLSQAGDLKGGIDVVSQPGNPPVLGQQRTVTLLVNFQNTAQPSFTSAQVDNFVDTQINNFYAELSYNKISITGDVYGWYTLPIDQTCSAGGTVLQEAINLADSAVYFPNYSRLVIIAPYGPSCGWAGAASIGKTTIVTADGNVSLSWASIVSNYGFDLGLVGHELGHGFGSGHASLLDCGSVTIAPSGCTVYEYGDPYDIMGSTSPPFHFNAAHKENVGWFDPTNIQTVTTSGAYVLEPIERATASLKALKIQRGQSTADYLYVEYRQPIGFDSAKSPSDSVYQGALLHIPLSPINKTALLDPTPPISISTIVVTPGSSFTDPDTGTRIAVTSATASALTLNVVLGKTDFTVPTVSITAPSSGATVSGTVTIAANAADASGIKEVEFAYIPYGGMGQVIATDTTEPFSVPWDTTKVADGGYTLTATAYDKSGEAFGVPNNLGGASTVSVTVNNATCTRANPTVSLAPASQGGTAGTTLSYTVSVTNSDNSVCGSSTFSLSSIVPTGWSATFTPASLTLTSGANGSSTIKVTSSTSASAGNYTISTTATNSSAASYSASTSAVYQVTSLTKTGDLNSDGKVDIFDLSILLTRWGSSDTTADLNKNGTVDIFDLSILLSYWGS